MALAADFLREHRDPTNEDELGVLTGIKIFKGSLVMWLTAVGYATLAADTAKGWFLGMALDQADNAAGASGDLNVRIQKEGWIRVTLTGVAEADKGKICYINDDDSVTLASTNHVVVGIVKGVAATNVAWVDISAKHRTGEPIAHIADPAACAAPTATDPAAPAAQTLAAVGDLVAVQNTGWGATAEADFDKIWDAIDKAAADMAALYTAMAAHDTQIVALIADDAAMKTAIDIHNTKIDAILVAIEEGKLTLDA